MRAQDDLGALGPLCADQRVLTQQDLADVLSACHPHHRPAQEVGLEHISVPLPPRAVEAGALGTSCGSARGSRQALPPRPVPRRLTWSSQCRVSPKKGQPMEPLGKGRALARSRLRLQRSAHRCRHRVISRARANSTSAAASGQEGPAGILLRRRGRAGRRCQARGAGAPRLGYGRCATGPAGCCPLGPARLLLPVRPSATFI